MVQQYPALYCVGWVRSETMKLVCVCVTIIPFEMISPLFRSLHYWGPPSFVLSPLSLYFLLCFSFHWKSKLAYPHTQQWREEIEKSTSPAIIQRCPLGGRGVRGLSLPIVQPWRPETGEGFQLLPPDNGPLGGGQDWQSITRALVQIEGVKGVIGLHTSTCLTLGFGCQETF